MAEVAGSDGSGSAMEIANTSSSGGGSTAAGEPGDGAARAETADSEQDDEEDVFEVESILDAKTVEGNVMYRVRWKGYGSDGDTWEPEAHLDDCKEVLLEFRRKLLEAKQKAAKKETPKLTLGDVFEADSDSEPQSELKDASPLKKKKKSKEEEDEKLQEELRKKKKSSKSREKSRSESERSEDQSPEPKPKKRTSEGKEDLNNKKQKKEDSKESKKLKKEEFKESNVKVKEEQKEKRHKKEKPTEPEQSSQSDEVFQEPASETDNMSTEPALEEKARTDHEMDDKPQETSPDIQEENVSKSQAMEDESDDVKLKQKKKKHKKMKTDRVDESKSSPTDELTMDKKTLHKKQKHPEKVKEVPALEKLQPLPVPVQKTFKPATEEKPRKSVESLPDKEARKPGIGKEKFKKKHEKELKKEPKVIKHSKEPKSTPHGFTISADDMNDVLDTSRKREDPSLDYRLPEDSRAKELKPVFKERRNTREETDQWSFTTSEGDQEVMEPMCHVQDNSAALESKSQVMGLGMDLQLEWMTLEDFQKHLDGSDELLPTETISNNALKDAVKNGDYLTVKFALNSTEEYNLDQEDSSGMTLVMMAAAAGQDDLLRLLLKKGAKINARQKNGTTALIHAAEKNYLTTVALLLEAGAYVNMQQATGETALMKACKRGNSDIVRLLIEHGADCNVLSKHQSNALQFAKQSNNVLLFELLKSHLETLTRVVEDAIRDYFETRLALLEPIFPIACHRLCEGPDFSLDFNYKPPSLPSGSGILLFVFHANFFSKEVVVRLCGPCSVQAVVLNDKFQLPVFLDAHFIYSFSPVVGLNKLFIRLSEVPNAKVKLLICAYRVQLQ
ncbi:M-phase phosphoprotein 8 [Pelodytes ibericus]